MNRDGSFNIDESSFQTESFSDLYHFLLSASWARVLGLVVFAYFLVNLVFGMAYDLAGPAALEGLQNQAGIGRFLECFFFSVQTLATIGYGRISPVSMPAHALVTIEALIGLLGFAMATGIIFSRFSRPTARVLFSDKALITPIEGQPSLIFRMANVRLNQIVEAQVRVVLARYEKTREGLTFREIYDLKLERERSPIFSMSWTIVHPIDEASPLSGATPQSLREGEAELIVTVVGTDETFSQSVHSRFSYAAEDFVWDEVFVDMVSRMPDGKLHVDLTKIDETGPAAQLKP